MARHCLRHLQNRILSESSLEYLLTWNGAAWKEYAERKNYMKTIFNIPGQLFDVPIIFNVFAPRLTMEAAIDTFSRSNSLNQSTIRALFIKLWIRSVSADFLMIAKKGNFDIHDAKPNFAINSVDFGQLSTVSILLSVIVWIIVKVQHENLQLLIDHRSHSLWIDYLSFSTCCRSIQGSS